MNYELPTIYITCDFSFLTNFMEILNLTFHKNKIFMYSLIKLFYVLKLFVYIDNNYINVQHNETPLIHFTKY